MFYLAMEEQKQENLKMEHETKQSLPSDYLERVYAGVLGKLIGVYMGRPFEGWTHERILAELGHVRYYVNEKLNVPIVVTDDDISGTFTFVRALEEHYTPKHNCTPKQENDGESEDKMNLTVSPETSGTSETPDTPDTPRTPGTLELVSEDPITAEQIGKTWLNNIIKNRTVFWWGGNGVSTEHTAFLNLRKGIKAPHSGSMQTNGRTIAEQIGAQIFIDGFAMTAPGNPALAAKLARTAASVSHDGEAVYAAQLWAAMEAEAFVSKDVDHLLDTGLSFVPSDSLIAALIQDVREWCQDDDDWMYTRQRIEKKYGYDKFPGSCHVVPNHGIMIMSLIYGGNNFAEAMHIVNTSGWDTDCNSGNVGCLVAIMHGLAAVEYECSGGNGNCNWRGPISDRALISSADGGYSINNAANIAYNIANTGRKLAGQDALMSPKQGAQFHFSLPGSVQGFYNANDSVGNSSPDVKQGVFKGNSGLLIQARAYIMTDTFIPPTIDQVHGYELAASPLLYPGQVISASLRSTDLSWYGNTAKIVLKAYTHKDELETLEGTSCRTNEPTVLRWRVPISLGCRPVQAVGLWAEARGTTLVDYLRWDGTPALILEPGDYRDGPRTFYKRSFVNGADMFDISSGSFLIAQDQGEGIVTYGTREWTDYKATFRDFTVNLGEPAGVAVRVRGLNRYYALFFYTGNADTRNARKRIGLVKARDGEHIELASKRFDWKCDVSYSVTLKMSGDQLYARVGKTELSARDAEYPAGGIGMVATDGSISVGSVKIGPLV
ncbi:ADP-ribosylglycohydrolase [Daldinia bambusicola]|nr:ADP-ribosylglycohydrolase [Daldinia bambusicola]